MVGVPEQLTPSPPPEAALTHNLAILVQLHGGAVRSQAPGVGRGKVWLGSRLPKTPSTSPPPPCTPTPHPADTSRDLPFGTLDVGGVAEEPGKVLVELLHRRPHRPKSEPHAVLQAGHRVCRESAWVGAPSRRAGPHALAPMCPGALCLCDRGGGRPLHQGSYERMRKGGLGQRNSPRPAGPSIPPTNAAAPGPGPRGPRARSPLPPRESQRAPERGHDSGACARARVHPLGLGHPHVFCACVPSQLSL